MRNITVVGLGYVGFPLAYELSKEFNVIGYDINNYKIEQYKNGINVVDFNNKISYKDRNITFSSDINSCKESSIYIIAVPTPIDDNMKPKMDYLYEASKAVGSVINKMILLFMNLLFTQLQQKKNVYQ